jgi:hypothetical protein
MAVLTDQFSSEINLGNNRPAIYYGFSPYFNPAITARELRSTADDNYLELNGNAKIGGYLWVDAWYSLGSNTDPFYLNNGINIELVLDSTKHKAAPHVTSYARVGKEDENFIEVPVTRGVQSLHNEQSLRRAIENATHQAVNASLESRHINSRHKKKVAAHPYCNGQRLMRMPR